MNDKMKALFASRRFWVAVAGVVTVVGSGVLGVELNADQVQGVVLVVAAWIVGDAIRETK